MVQYFNLPGALIVLTADGGDVVVPGDDVYVQHGAGVDGHERFGFVQRLEERWQQWPEHAEDSTGGGGDGGLWKQAGGRRSGRRSGC